MSDKNSPLKYEYNRLPRAGPNPNPPRADRLRPHLWRRADRAAGATAEAGRQA